jgi:dihydrofolate reductase
MNVPFSIILAMDTQNGIGKNNDLPWRIREDLRLFSQITRNNVVIMGRNTWDSLPKKPLPFRINVVISRSVEPENLPESVIWVNDIENVEFQQRLEAFKTQGKEIFCIGGAGLLDTFKRYKSLCSKMYIHQIGEKYDCDTFFPLREWTGLGEGMVANITLDKQVFDASLHKMVKYTQTIWIKPN